MGWLSKFKIFFIYTRNNILYCYHSKKIIGVSNIPKMELWRFSLVPTFVSCDNTIFAQSLSPSVCCDNSTSGQAYEIKCSDVYCMLCWFPNFLWLPPFSTTLLPDWMNIDSRYPICNLMSFYYLVLVVTIQVPENTCASTRCIGKKEGPCL
jgi:hypothetical protein